MSRRIALIVPLVLLVGVAAAAQKPDADHEKAASQYQAAFNTGDAKGLAALYTADGLRVGPDGQMVAGRMDIEQSYAAAFSGALKGAQLTLTPGRTVSVTPDVKIVEGTFSVAGTMPAKGRYVNTLARQRGQWLLASATARFDAPPVK